MFRADLHTHTYYSDGSLSPAELIQLALDSDLDGLSITDHDTLEAYETALPLAQTLGLKLLTGIELSTYYEHHTVHILGYGIDLSNKPLLEWCNDLALARTDRNLLILEKLAQKRLYIDQTELHTVFSQRIIGRPHIAQLMLKKGYVHSIKAAFNDYLGDKACCAPEPLTILSIPQAIGLIHQAGGRAVLAHPHRFKNIKLVKKILDLGQHFDGLEAYYSLLPKHLEAPIIELAKSYKLFITGGSDFHGAVTPHTKLGCSFSPQAIFEKLYNNT